jgi:hypothetical protein
MVDTVDLSRDHGSALQEVWEAVSDRIIERMMDLTRERVDTLHISLRPEMILALAKLRFGVYSRVAQIRQGGRVLSDIDIAMEKAQYFNSEGMELIEMSARICAASWLSRYRKRWKPKSLNALEREKNPPKPKPRLPKAVDKNHFIAKAFIKRYWTSNGKVKIWRRDSHGRFATSEVISYGMWGHGANLYSDKLEDYFVLVEGDAAEPMRMLLAQEPLNHQQREALIGFFMIQLLRNPFFLDRIEHGMKVLVESEVGSLKSQDQGYMMAVRESFFRNNDFYNLIASPVFWNTWVMVQSEDAFILPDTWGVLRRETESESLFCVPLTPSDCFLSLSPRERQKRVLPISISVDQRRASQINRLLTTEHTSEFISGLDFECCSEEPEDQESLLRWIKKEVHRVNAEIWDWV